MKYIEKVRTIKHARKCFLKGDFHEMTYEIKGTQIYCLNELTLRFQSVNQSTKVEVYTTYLT